MLFRSPGNSGIQTDQGTLLALGVEERRAFCPSCSVQGVGTVYTSPGCDQECKEGPVVETEGSYGGGCSGDIEGSYGGGCDSPGWR